MEQFRIRQSNVAGWTRNGDNLGFQPARSFCVAETFNVIIELTEHPPFRCEEYELIAQNSDGKWKLSSIKGICLHK